MEESEPKPSWPHAPVHKLGDTGTYMVTAGTYLKEHHFRSPKKLHYLQDRLLQYTSEAGWQLEAWAVFSNHYHFIANSPPKADSANGLHDLLHRLHNRTAEWINREDNTPGRKVWHNFRDTRLTFHNSYLARLQYVHQNAVKHQLVSKASLYPWCSAGWLERTTSPTMLTTLARFQTSKVKVQDDFNPELDRE